MSAEEKRLEYRVCWAASSNGRFRGETDWAPAAEGESAEDLEASLSSSAGGIPEGLDLALNGSGFEWWVETREAAHA